MPVVLRDCRVIAGGHDVSGTANKCELEISRAAEDVTNFDSAGWRERSAGLSGCSVAVITAEDLEEWQALDAAMAEIAPFTFVPEPALGAAGYSIEALMTKLTRKLEVGKSLVGEYQGKSTSPLRRGKITAIGAKVAGGNGSAINLGAVPAGKTLFAVLHVLSITGGTLTAKIESDASASFSTPIDRLTFAAKSAAGAESKEAAGAISDSYFRASWALTGGSADILIMVGVR
jgi:hypothetical protein